MARYHFKRYKSEFHYADTWTESTYTNSYTFWPKGTTYQPTTTNPNLEFGLAREVLGIDSTTGFYAISRYYSKVLDTNSDYLYSGYEYVVIDPPDKAYTCQATNSITPYSAQHNSTAARWPSHEYTLSKVYTRGEYIDELIAEESEYPDSGHSEADGYWYEKGELATQFYARVDGTWKGAIPYARINGIWVEAQPEVLTGGDVFSIDASGNAALSCALTVDAAGDGTASCGVNVYHGGFAEV